MAFLSCSQYSQSCVSHRDCGVDAPHHDRGQPDAPTAPTPVVVWTGQTATHQKHDAPYNPEGRREARRRHFSMLRVCHQSEQERLDIDRRQNEDGCEVLAEGIPSTLIILMAHVILAPVTYSDSCTLWLSCTLAL